MPSLADNQREAVRRMTAAIEVDPEIVPVRPSPARMRNYAAMGTPKLERCIRELDERRGDAWDRCRRAFGDVDEHLAEARHARDTRTAAEFIAAHPTARS